MGDIVHALPAVASLKKSFPESELTWLVAAKWRELLEGNPYVDRLVFSGQPGIWSTLRALRPELAIDLQGLLKSAIAGRFARPKIFFGFDPAVAREPLAAKLYSHRIRVRGPHRVERNLQLVEAAGANKLTEEAWLPEGTDEQLLPSRPFILASPFAGWEGKQWPIEYYEQLAKMLQFEGIDLVANVSLERAKELTHLKYLQLHSSSISGLIAATRKASAVLGVDSGPLHIAAALKKPGVALFGPTDPAQTGPFGGSMTVLRTPEVETTYKRHGEVHESMTKLQVADVAAALLRSMALQVR